MKSHKLINTYNTTSPCKKRKIPHNVCIYISCYQRISRKFPWIPRDVLLPYQWCVTSTWLLFDVDMERRSLTKNLDLVSSSWAAMSRLKGLYWWNHYHMFFQWFDWVVMTIKVHELCTHLLQFQFDGMWGLQWNTCYVGHVLGFFLSSLSICRCSAQGNCCNLSQISWQFTLLLHLQFYDI